MTSGDGGEEGPLTRAIFKGPCALDRFIGMDGWMDGGEREAHSRYLAASDGSNINLVKGQLIVWM